MPDGSVSQRNRPGKFHAPLGPDALTLVRFDGDKGINALGAFRLDVQFPTGIVDQDALPGLQGTVEITTLLHGHSFMTASSSGPSRLRNAQMGGHACISRYQPMEYKV